MSNGNPITFDEAQQQVLAQAQAEHDAQFGAMSRKLALANRLAKTSNAYIKQLEAEVERLRGVIVEYEQRMQPQVAGDIIDAAAQPLDFPTSRVSQSVGPLDTPQVLAGAPAAVGGGGG